MLINDYICTFIPISHILQLCTRKMESAVTLDRLKNHFETIINRTFLAYDLRNCRDPADKETLRVIEQDVRYMEKAVADLKKVKTLVEMALKRGGGGGALNYIFDVSSPSPQQRRVL